MSEPAGLVELAIACEDVEAVTASILLKAGNIPAVVDVTIEFPAISETGWLSKLPVEDVVRTFTGMPASLRVFG